MKKARRTNGGATGGVVEVATVEIGLDGRSGALDLMAALIPFHSFIVQHDREHWVVHARVPGCHGETLDDLVTTIDRLGSDSGLSFTSTLGDQAVDLAGKQAPHLAELAGPGKQS